ncbi:SETMR methyltransferase, partial [Acromyrmex insinuator]
MKKLSARWVPRLFTVDHKRDRVTISKQCFNVIGRTSTYDAPRSGGPIEAATPKIFDKVHDIVLLAKKKMFFHQDNVWVHTYPAPMAKFNEFRYELLPHPAYSPDLAPCNYFLFPEKIVRRKEIQHQRTARRIAETDFERLDKSYYLA